MMTAKMGERDSTEEIMKAFKLFDDDETGKISFKKLKSVAKELGENMTYEELQVCATASHKGSRGPLILATYSACIQVFQKLAFCICQLIIRQ